MTRLNSPNVLEEDERWANPQVQQIKYLADEP